MRRPFLRRFTRREILGAARVALIATSLVTIAYAGVVAILDVVVSVHLTSQVDRQLTDRLSLARTNPEKAFESAGVQSNGARYGLGIYGEPIALWSFSHSGTLNREAPGDPVLPARTAPPATGDSSQSNDGIGGTTYRIQWMRTPTGWLLAGESLSELGHVEAVLVISEAVAFPFLLVAFFLVALAIGLRSARPVEIARRRQLDFTADASHEIRTPLSVIEAEVSLALIQRREPAQYEAALGRIGEESVRLSRIVDDLLFLARADSEPAQPAAVATDVAEVVRRCGERFVTVAGANNQVLRVDVAPPGEPALVVRAPPDWLDRLAGTLVDNACRYAGDGAQITVSARLASANRVVLSVEDDGPGIDAGSRGEVLHRFKRASDEPGGHGLGLAIADSVVRGTGGRLAVRQSSPTGAIFEASWPLGSDDNKATGSDANMGDGSDAGPVGGRSAGAADLRREVDAESLGDK